MEQARIKELKKISADIKLGALEDVYKRQVYISELKRLEVT